MIRLAFAVTVLFLGYCQTAVGSQMFLYWTETGSGKIERANLDGSHVTDLVTGLNQPRGITIDATHGKLYWTTDQGGNGSGTLQRANLDGSGVQTVLAALGAPEGVAIDPTAGFAYYTDRSDPSGSPNDRGIHPVNFDGTGKTLVVSTRNGPSDPSNPIDIALDLSAGKMYWTDDGPDSLSRANLDGTGHAVFLSGPFGTSGIGLDIASNHIFWTNYGTHEIRRANLDGTSNTQILGSLGATAALALDLSAGKMYWTEFDTGKIRVAGLDGSGVQDLVLTANQPDGIAIGVPEPASWVLAMVGASLAFVRWLGRRLQQARCRPHEAPVDFIAGLHRIHVGSVS